MYPNNAMKRNSSNIDNSETNSLESSNTNNPRKQRKSSRGTSFLPQQNVFAGKSSPLYTAPEPTTVSAYQGKCLVCFEVGVLELFVGCFSEI